MTAKRTYVVDARTATPHFPGIGRYVTGLLPALAAQLAPGERLAILCTDDAQVADLQKNMNFWPNTTYFIAPDSPFSLGQQWSVPRLLRRMPAPAVYHSPYYLMPYRPGIPAVATIHDLIPCSTRRLYRPCGAALLFRIAVRLALRADGDRRRRGVAPRSGSHPGRRPSARRRHALRSRARTSIPAPPQKSTACGLPVRPAGRVHPLLRQQQAAQEPCYAC